MPELEEPSVRSTIKAGACRAAEAVRPTVTCCKASSRPSPMAVLPFGRSVFSAFSTAPRSVVSGEIRLARSSKLTSPTRAEGGSWSIKVRAAERAAAMREGWTSVAAMEPETSITSTTSERLRATSRFSTGCAAATISPARPSRKSVVGRCLRTPGPRGTTFESKSRFVKRTT